jgi:ribosomal protein S8E
LLVFQGSTKEFDPGTERLHCQVDGEAGGAEEERERRRREEIGRGRGKKTFGRKRREKKERGRGGETKKRGKLKKLLFFKIAFSSKKCDFSCM